MTTPHGFSLRQLQYAVAVAETLSFRQAAARCHVSQPSLSAQIQALEAALDVQLFERSQRRVLPTAAGDALIAYAARVLRDADELQTAAAQLRDPWKGLFRIGVIPTISPYLLPSVAPILRRAHPGLTIRWREDKTAVLMAALDKGELDAALVAREAPLGDVAQAIVAHDPFVLVASPRSPLGKRTGQATPRELADQPVLLLDDGHCFAEQALQFCSRAHAKELAFRATSLPTLVQMVANDEGVTLLPALAVRDETARTGLRVRPFSRPAPSRTIVLVWRKGAALAAVMTKLAHELRTAYPQS